MTHSVPTLRSSDLNSGVFKARINGVGHRGPSGRLHRRHAVSTVHDRRAWLARSTKENRFPLALVRWRASFHSGLPHRQREQEREKHTRRVLKRLTHVMPKSTIAHRTTP